MLQHYDRVLALQSAVRWPPRGASDRQPREGGLSIQKYCPNIPDLPQIQQQWLWAPESQSTACHL